MGALFLSIPISGVGFVLLTYGRKQDRVPQLVAGLLLLVYPYFTPGVWPMLLVGALIIGGMWLAIRQGW